MILIWLLAILLGSGILAGLSNALKTNAPRWIALAALSADFVIVLVLWLRHYSQILSISRGNWFEQVDWNWVPRFGIHFHLAMDGLSLLLLMLTYFLGIISVLVSWTEIEQRVGFFHFNLLWMLGSISAVFLALDLFLFYFAWELMLVPMYFLIAVWGHEHRQYASVKFFLFTQLSGLLMLIAILALYFVYHAQTGTYTFEYEQLLATHPSHLAALWMMLGFFIAFAVKLAVVPVHTWLPNAYSEAPTAVVLAGLLLETGAYGLLRFVLPLFPEAAHEFAPIARVLAVIGILYGALLAFGQTDLKRLIAYISISHLGFVLLGIFAWNELALEGAVVSIVAHGVSTGALFVIAGLLQDRMHTRNVDRMGGLWGTVPRLSGTALFFALGALGLPGLGDFVGEFLVLLGTYRVSRSLAILAAIGVLFATLYALRLVQAIFHGSNLHGWELADLNRREALILTPLVTVLLWLGLYPLPVLNTFGAAVKNLSRYSNGRVAMLRR